MRSHLTRPHVRSTVRAISLGVSSVVLAATLAGCGSDDDSDPSAEDTSSAQASPSDASSAPTESEDSGESEDGGDDNGVELVDAGSGDQRVLELDVEVGQTMTSDLTVTTTGEGGAAVTPPITVTTRSEVTAVDDDTISATQTFTRVQAQGGGAAFAKVFDAMQGISIDLELDRSGTVESADVDIPVSAPPQVQALADQLGDQVSATTVPFPTEEVGEGAQWRATTETDSSGVSITVLSTYTLTALDGDDYSLEVTTKQDFGAQGSGSGTGTAEGSTTQLSPTSSRSAVTSTIAGQTLEVRSELTSTLD